eukprot:TRINITY_DN30787_c0_g1_i1.p1 TRINITY_DN30787_c0_g1~~TRINITY_DN30787_c0_g1_i1.p1  ORF type:complete len:206 (+),score=59.84 TRINITY_DN30787_c0_g1_i1:248-865(+)
MQVRFEQSTADYLIAEDDPEGARCQSSWNKLWGNSRCGYLNLHHKDSDRFVWRRDVRCIEFNGSHVMGVVPNCTFANQVQIAAYAYDDGNIPYQNASLLAEFNTTLTVGDVYFTRLDFAPDGTQYTLLDGRNATLETHFIAHRNCGHGYQHGYGLGFYFGGVCTAPQTVTACFAKEPTPTDAKHGKASRQAIPAENKPPFVCGTE